MRSLFWTLAIGCLVHTSAYAWTAADQRAVTVPEAAHAVAAGTWDGGPAVFITGQAGTTVLDPGSGEVLGSLAQGGHDLLVQDLDQDGTDEVLLCGPAGIALLRGTRDELTPPHTLSDVPCDRLHAYDVGEYSALLVGAGSSATSWLPEPGGLTSTPIVDGLGGPALVAARGERVAAAGAGATTLHRLGLTPVELDAPILDLAPAADGWWVVLGGDDTALLEVGGQERRVSLEPAPSGLRSVPLGADGAPLLLLLDASERRIGLLDEGGRLGWLSVEVEPHAVAAADLDDDGCGDLVVVGRGGAGAVLVGDCDSALPAARVIAQAGGWADLAAATVAPDETAVPAVGESTEEEAAPVDRRSAGVLPAPPTEHALGEAWGDMHLVVGQRAQVQLLDQLAGSTRSFKSRGGPPGFATTSTGMVDFEPEPDDVGLWRVSVQMKGGGRTSRWNGLMLHVHADPSGGSSARPHAASSSSAGFGSADDEEEDSDDSGPVVAVRAVPERSGKPFAGFRGCQLAMGVAGGAAKAGGPTWEELGQAEVRGAASPMVAFGCLGAISGPVGWFGGFDTAPFFEYASLPRDRVHVLALVVGIDVGSPRVSVGLYGTTGLGLRPSPGLRTQLRPFGSEERPWGMEIRALWLAPQVGGELAALFVFRL